MADSAGSGWKYSGEWDPSSVDYELEDLDFSGIVALIKEAKEEAARLKAKVEQLSGVAQLGGLSPEEMRRQDELRQRMQLQELRAAYLDQKFRDRMAQQMAGSAH
mmetsp:Transcript_31199/g.80603  ORF Transcript_31199/g.80603 Transcript_31199/m.80603 type:complete len:105 (-) Transcript_31199:161-475(-)